MPHLKVKVFLVCSVLGWSLFSGIAFAGGYGKNKELTVWGPTPLNPEVHYSLKKGFVYSAQDPYLCSKLTALGVSWFYTWGPHRPQGVTQSLSFTPQIWGRGWLKDTGVLITLKNTRDTDDTGALLTSNEPDKKNQSNLSVEEVLSFWPSFQATGRRLGSPAMAGNPLKNGSWLRGFMQKAENQNDRVDFIALHWYGPPDADKFLAWIDKVHSTFGKPIWITEFAVADWKAKGGGRNRYSTADVIHFMSQVIPELKKRDFVERYAWKTRVVSDPVMGTSALFNRNGTLTKVGKCYSQL